MTLFAAGVIGVVVSGVGLAVVRVVWSRPPHLRQNYRGREVIGTGGAVLIKALVAVGLVSLFVQDGRGDAVAMLACGVTMATLGYIDDVYGDRRAGGLVGHARALLRGTFTTGMLKALGGAAVGLGAAWIVGWRGWWTIAAGAVIALASNLANLFDLRPGRVIKIWVPLAAWAAVAIGDRSGRTVLVGLAAAALVFVVAELRERVMLGDTGAGLLGGVLGVASVAVVGRRGLLVTLSSLLVLTLVSEGVSFSRVIDAVPPLRWLDRLGRAR